MIKFLIFLSAIVYANSASVKREEYNPDPISNVASNNSPVYNPTQGSANGYSSYSSNYANPSAISNQNSNNAALNYASNQPAVDSNQAYVDNVAAAASNIQSTQPNQPSYSNLNQGGNLFYYYFPVQDKNKDINYQASPSNQYTSSIVQPQQNDEQSNQNNNNNSPQNSGHDLNYGAQDLAYTASAINENNNAQQAANNNYDSQLSNLASALNQYNFGSGNGNGFSNSQFASQLSGLNNLGGLSQGFGEAFSGSMQQPNSVPFVNDPAFTAAMANQLGNFQSQPSSSSGSGGPFSQLYQQATQVYQGLLNSATGGQSANQQPQFAASQQHPSYEASTGGSGFRSKYAGLSLLIPTVQSLSTVASRKKRSAEDNLDLQQAGLGSYAERIDRYYSLYKNAIEKEDCMNRIICEIGSTLSSVRGKDQLFDFVERVMPNSWNSKGSKVSILKTSALSSSDNAKCKKYRCH